MLTLSFATFASTILGFAIGLMYCYFNDFNVWFEHWMAPTLVVAIGLATCGYISIWLVVVFLICWAAQEYYEL